jgi:hypothetical protein
VPALESGSVRDWLRADGALHFQNSIHIFTGKDSVTVVLGNRGWIDPVHRLPVVGSRLQSEQFRVVIQGQLTIIEISYGGTSESGLSLWRIVDVRKLIICNINLIFGNQNSKHQEIRLGHNKYLDIL